MAALDDYHKIVDDLESVDASSMKWMVIIDFDNMNWMTVSVHWHDHFWHWMIKHPLYISHAVIPKDA